MIYRDTRIKSVIALSLNTRLAEMRFQFQYAYFNSFFFSRYSLCMNSIYKIHKEFTRQLSYQRKIPKRILIRSVYLQSELYLSCTNLIDVRLFVIYSAFQRIKKYIGGRWVLLNFDFQLFYALVKYSVRHPITTF